MASHQYKPPSSPIKEHEHEGEGVDDYLNSEEAASSSSCFCFQWWSRGSYHNAHRPLLDGDDSHHRHGQWWKAVKEKLMEAREFTEVVAGPKWKTFIRRVGGYFGKNKKAQRGQFGYDAESYALNFDGGFDREGEEDDALMYNIRSSRFTAPSLESNNEYNHGGL
ncbi:uncharacterized protein LOC116197694 [Punica granatum]|uniref:Stress induced protein n=2 Tax=Punica granatum TaxID=22663 RepID=A0A218WLE5_PUNGR|nr:uncharacterized protein LOC116197694 [Punica granatum]OWM72852.1 hypothetical protein CDL15_Pgr021158 [Punica granatum]PKI64702.1 hypothetical protein CRG98_014918 [Punica granatum]